MPVLDGNFEAFVTNLGKYHNNLRVLLQIPGDN